MKQSTFSAVMANSIKNLLQGYTKGIRFTAILTLLFTIGVGQIWAEGTETFENLTSVSSYASRSWTGVNGQTWSATLARTDQKISGNRGLTFSNANSSKTITMKLTDAQKAAGIGTFTFKYKHPYSDSGKTNTFSISVNGSNYSSGTLSYTSSTATKTITINAVPNSTSITITITGTARLCVDDFSWTSYASNKTVYLKPTSAWDNSSAKFAVYYFNNSTNTNGWSSLMTKVDNKCNNDVYKAEIPSSYTNLIFVRLNSTATGGDWNNKWDQTADLTLSGTNNMYTISAHGSNGGKASGSWSAYKEEVQVTYNFQKTGISNITECVVKGQTTANKSYNLLGWKLDGWYKESACTNQWNFSTTVTSEMTLYAKWSEPATTTVYLNANSNGVNWTQDNADIWVHAFMSSTGEYKDIQMTPVNTCDVNWLKAEGIPYGVDKLIFLRVADGVGVVWSGSNLWNQAAEIGYSGSTSYYQMDSWSAVKTATAYQPSTYTISYNSGGGTGSMASTTVECDGSITLPANSFTRTGYTFNGWKDASGKTYTDKSTISNIKSNITLTAQWKVNTYTIISNLTNCSSSPAIPASYTYTGSAANLTYTITPASDCRLPDAITVSGCAYTWDKTTGQLKLTGTISGNVTITIEAVKVYTITWKVNEQQYVEKQEVVDGQTIGSLPNAPDAPATCSDKVFMGWTESATVNSDGTGITYISTSTKPDGDKTYHAVFATKEGGSTSVVTDKLTRATTGISNGAGYGTWSGKKATSSAVYAGQSAGGNDAIQIRTTNSNSGIITTTSGGKITKVSVVWNSNTTSSRTLNVYGKNSAYTAATDLYDTSIDGDLLGTIVYGTSTELIISGDYQYIGLRSSSGAMYLTSVSITWSAGTEPTYTEYVTSCTPQFTITLNPNGGTIDDNDWKYDNGTGYYTQTVSDGTELNFPTATKTGYTNIGWKKNNTGTPVTSIIVSENATYTAAYDCALATVGISGTYALTVGDVFELVATAYDSNGDVLTCPANTTSYSWERYNSVDGVWEAITDDNSDGDDAKLTFNNCQIANCGTYRCHVSYGECEASSHTTAADGGFNVHCFHLKGDFEDNWNIEYAFNHTDEPGIATLTLDLISGHTHNFKIYDGISQYGNGGTITASVTGWTYETTIDSDTKLQTGADGSYVFTLNYTQLINNSTNILVLDVTYPPSNQSEGYTVYYDNLVHNWQNVYYRIGHNRDNGDGTWGWNQNQEMTKVPGTSHLYKTTTPTFDNFEAWHIANNVSWADKNSIYLVNPDGTEYDITHATVFKKFVVVEDITLTPEATGTFVNGENCTYYADVKQSGMKMHKATVIPATGGTITVSYTDHDGTAKSDFTSGDRDLAHTCLLTITATPDAGYSLGTLTVNDDPFTSGNVHTLAENAVIKVVWNTNQYTVSFDGNGADGGSTASVSGNYLTTVTLTPNGFTRTGYTFSGWNTKSDGTGTPYADGAPFNILPQNVTLYAQWEKAYIVEFSHNDKGIFNGEEIVYVPTNDNIITLPTVEDVSCGFYDTFEGWIVSNDEYVESTTKPATVYIGGASYRVTGDCTFRALYSKCEGDATQVYRKVTSTGEVTDGTYILVANTSTPRVYSGYGGATYGSSVEGLSADGEDFTTTLPASAKPITVTVGTGTNAGTFAMYNADRSKYLTYTGSSNTLNESDTKVFIWKLTDGSNVNSKSCPAGVLTPNGFDTRVLQCNTSSSNRFACYTNSQSSHVFLYKLIDKCTKYYSTNPSCEKPVGVHIVYNANAVDASMSCNTQDRTYKVVSGENQYPELASQLQFCTNATREGYTLAGWNTQPNGQGTTYNINQNYYRLPVSGDLDDDNWITLNLYAVWKQSVKFDLGNATGGTGVPDAIVENGECVLPEPTAEQLGTIPCAYEFYAWSETSVNATQTKPALLMPGDTYTGSALTLYAVYRLCETGSNADLFSLSYTISGTKYYVGPVLDTRENRSTKFSAVTNENDATVFGMKSVEGQTYKSLFWVDSEGNNKYMYWKDYSASFQFTSEEDDSYGWTVTGTTNLTFVSTPYMTNGSRYLSADASEIGCPSDPKAVTQFTKEAASTQVCTYATNPECFTAATLQFITNGGTLNYPASYSEINYQDLTIGTTVYLPTATFAGEWEFEGWLKGSALESQTMRPETTNFIEVELNTTTYTANATGTTTFYAVYSKTNDDKQFDPVNGGTYKLFAIGADGTKTYMPVWTGTRGTPSGVTTCAETGDYTITPGTGTHAGQYQITCGEYTLGVVSGNTDLNKVEGTWWNIKPSESGKGTWRITVVGSTDDRALSCLFSTAKSFGNYALSQVNSSSQSIYRDMEIGECIFTEYTSTPENIPYITVTGAPVKITSAKGERVYASTTVHIEAHNFTGERIIHLSATNGFGVDPAQVRTNGQGAYSGNVKVYYEPTTDGDGQTIATSVLTAAQTGGTNAEKISQTFSNIQGRNLPANFVIAAKWDGHWYALPANCTSSLSSTEGLLIEVDDADNPTRATQAPASAKYGIREVIPSRQTDHGQGIVFTERYLEGNKEYSLYNNGTSANLQVYSQYSNYAATNPERYEWTPSTTDFVEYTLTNANSSRKITLNNSGVFSATTASGQVRLLPATFYEPAPVQVLKWKANSVIVMYTGAEATATTQVGNNSVSTEQTLADQQLTHGIYELTTNQALTNNAGGALKLNFGANTRVELEIPLIISGEVTASANGHDVVVLENSKLTADATKYSYKDVYVYGGAKLAIPENTELDVNNIILRAGGVATNGDGRDATYQYIYPQVELKGTLTSAVQNIRYEYVTDYDHWYHLVLPFDGSLASIHYPYEYYGDQVKLDNKGSWIIKRYDGATRATGNYDAWKNIEEDVPGATVVKAGHGYIYWGAPKKVTANGAYERPKWGIQRITMLSNVSETIAKATDAESKDKNISGLSSYKDVPNNSGKVNDQGWNLIGNPYMVNLTGLDSRSLKAGQLVHELDDNNNWTGGWELDSINATLRYITVPSDHFEWYEAKRVTKNMELSTGRTFFVQIDGTATDVMFEAANRAQLMPSLLAENNNPVDIETGIVLSNETMQDEVNFWIAEGMTNDYEYNADYPKTLNTTNFNVYGVHTNGYLSWVATGPEFAKESMPIGYQVPAAGTYMLSISEDYYSEDLDALYVTDHALSPEVTVDLMSNSYEFSVNQAETNNERFTVSLKLKSENQGPTTGLENIGVQTDGTIKFIYQDKIFILHNETIYDATGKKVTTINK
ncbi:MAG: InlB B-repeat-containing protein [Paludibacteraceae bacterium]|nr:InlB B-repeat-containing protein [Paludibacteraceae bacterium]